MHFQRDTAVVEERSGGRPEKYVLSSGVRLASFCQLGPKRDTKLLNSLEVLNYLTHRNPGSSRRVPVRKSARRFCRLEQNRTGRYGTALQAGCSFHSLCTKIARPVCGTVFDRSRRGSPANRWKISSSEGLMTAPWPSNFWEKAVMVEIWPESVDPSNKFLTYFTAAQDRQQKQQAQGEKCRTVLVVD